MNEETEPKKKKNKVLLGCIIVFVFVLIFCIFKPPSYGLYRFHLMDKLSEGEGYVYLKAGKVYFVHSTPGGIELVHLDEYKKDKGWYELKGYGVMKFKISLLKLEMDKETLSSLYSGEPIPWNEGTRSWNPFFYYKVEKELEKFSLP